MKDGMRLFLTITGLLLIYAAFLVWAAKPPAAVSYAIPPIPVTDNLPYSFYLRFIQWIFGLSAGAVMLANGVILILILGLAARVAWGISEPRYRYLAATTA